MHIYHEIVFNNLTWEYNNSFSCIDSNNHPCVPRISCILVSKLFRHTNLCFFFLIISGELAILVTLFLRHVGVTSPPFVSWDGYSALFRWCLHPFYLSIHLLLKVYCSGQRAYFFKIYISIYFRLNVIHISLNLLSFPSLSLFSLSPSPPLSLSISRPILKKPTKS